jgi:hypothetical protein
MTFLMNLPFVLVILGLASFVFAGFLYGQILGYAVLGAALILTAYVISPNIDRKGVSKQ